MLQKRTTYQFLLRIVQVALLIATVALGQINHPLQHWLVHGLAHEHVHNSEAEADPCHRATYHQDDVHGCRHPAHLDKPSFKCPDCDYTFGWSLEELTSTLLWLPTPPTTIMVTAYSCDLTNRWLAVTFLRGPPFV